MSKTCQKLLPGFGNLGHKCKFFQDVFVSDVNSEEFDVLVGSAADVPRRMVWACVVLRMLYDMAVDNFDRARATVADKQTASAESAEVVNGRVIVYDDSIHDSLL